MNCSGFKINRAIHRRRKISTLKRIFILVAACISILTPAISLDERALEKHITIQAEKGYFYHFHVELAITPEQMMTGLMNRKELKNRMGMLFLFDNEADRIFWMKDTLLLLDIIFIAGDGTIIHIYHKAQPLDSTLIYSFGPAKAVLEINGGESAILGIKVGDKVQHSAFGNTPFHYRQENDKR